MVSERTQSTKAGECQSWCEARYARYPKTALAHCGDALCSGCSYCAQQQQKSESLLQYQPEEDDSLLPRGAEQQLLAGQSETRLIRDDDEDDVMALPPRIALLAASQSHLKLRSRTADLREMRQREPPVLSRTAHLVRHSASPSLEPKGIVDPTGTNDILTPGLPRTSSLPDPQAAQAAASSAEIGRAHV